MQAAKAPHPIVYTVLYFPFGALGGFVGVPLTFMAKSHGLDITQASLLNGAQMLTSWLKWLWAPAVDVTLSPKRWYVISTMASAIGVFAMAVMPLSVATLPLFLAVIAGASLLNSMVGMSIEAIMAECTPESEQGRVGAWFQAGNLGGSGFGGGLGLFLLNRYSDTRITGVIMGGTFMACCLALPFLHGGEGTEHKAGELAAAVRGVVRQLGDLLKTRGGQMAALLCFLPISTGAAQGVLAQEGVAAYWHAGANEVAIIQGFGAGALTAFGCFIGGWLCDRFHPRTAYAGIGVAMGLCAIGMAVAPATVSMYLFWNVLYSLLVGLAYAAFTALVLNAIGTGSGATKYNIFASLSNFPIWWLGLLLGRTADLQGPAAMMAVEGMLGILGVGLFFLVNRRFGSR